MTCLDLARARLGHLGTVERLLDEPPVPDALGTDGQLAIAEHALTLVSRLYVNLFLKREIHAADPEQALRNLCNELRDIQLAQLETISDEEFHERLTAIFVSLRDRHTAYELPAPYRRTIAFLPFVVEHSDDPRGYFVTKVLGDGCDAFRPSEDPRQAPRITHWNGLPIARAVAQNADRNAGANRAARMARGLDRLTFRWLGTTTGPDEDWVDVTYELAGETHCKRFWWFTVQATQESLGDSRSQGTALGRDGEGEWIRRVKSALYSDPAVGEDRFAYRECTVDGRTFGYLRVYTFDVEDEDGFVSSVERCVRDAPRDGLIIDVRGNPGGRITAAERVIGLFSPLPVQSQQLYFRNTAEATTLAEKLYGTRRSFTDNVLEARATAAPFIASLPLADRQGHHRQVYQGQVMVIFDALTYSSAEVFTAGMADQELAVLRGTARQTGGGGANVWSYELLAETLGDDALPTELPGDASFTVAIRRITRVGRRNGVALEDLGVLVPETDILSVTYDDLAHGNRRLIAEAARQLGELPRRTLSAKPDENGQWTIAADGIDHAVVLLDGAVDRGIANPDGQRFSLPQGVRELTLQGVAGGRIVASAGYDL